MTLGEGGVPGELVERGPCSGSFGAGRSCWRGLCCRWRGAARWVGSCLPAQGLCGRRGPGSAAARAAAEVGWLAGGEAPSRCGAAGLAGRPSAGAGRGATAALLGPGTGLGRVASSPACWFCRARCQPGAYVNSCCKCYEFFTKQASLIA